MAQDIRVKICGLTRPGDVDAAVAAGAGYVGFVFFEKSPRNVDVATARALALRVPPGVAKVALVVDADDARLREIVEAVPLDMLQLHGAESPERVREVKARFGLPVMKALGHLGGGGSRPGGALCRGGGSALARCETAQGRDPARRQCGEFRLGSVARARPAAALDAGRGADARQCGAGGVAERRAAD